MNEFFLLNREGAKEEERREEWVFVVVYLRAIQSSRQNVNVSGSGFSVRNWSISSGLQPRDSIKASIQLVTASISMYFAPRHSGQVSVLTVPVPLHSGQSQWVFRESGLIRLLLIFGKSSIALQAHFSNFLFGNSPTQAQQRLQQYGWQIGFWPIWERDFIGNTGIFRKSDSS